MAFYGAAERRVLVGNLANRLLVGSFETDFEPGGRRLAVGRDIFVADGSSLSCYSPDGGKRWTLSINRPANLSIAGERLFCAQANGSLLAVDATTGRVLAEYRGLDSWTERQAEKPRVLEYASEFVLATHAGEVRVPKSGSILDVAYSDRQVLVCESQGRTTLFDFVGNKVACPQPKEGSHFVTVDFQAASGNFIGLRWSYANGGAPTVCVIGEHLIEECTPIPSIAARFAMAGSVIVTHLGEVYDADSGHVIGVFDGRLQEKGKQGQEK